MGKMETRIAFGPKPFGFLSHWFSVCGPLGTSSQHPGAYGAHAILNVFWDVLDFIYTDDLAPPNKSKPNMSKPIWYDTSNSEEKTGKMATDLSKTIR